jgi:hypothetical protein
MHLAFALSKFKLPVLAGAAAGKAVGGAVGAGALDFSELSIIRASVNKGPACV